MLKTGQEVIIAKDVGEFLIGVRARIRKISPINTLTVELLEDAKNATCWKAGMLMHLKPYNVKEVA
jgi:hypothetical protein